MKPKLKIRTKFYWKELTSDGLLKDITRGPYYDRSTLGYCGCSTREEAYEELLRWPDAKYGSYVLIEECDLVEEE